MASNASTLRSYARTLEEAAKRGEHWTQADLDFVAEFDGVVSDEEIARALGRTLYSIWTIKSVRAERDARPRKLAAHAVLAYDQGFTDLAAWDAM